LAKRRQRFSHADSPLGETAKPFARSERLTISTPLWTEHFSLSLHLEPVTAVHDGHNATAVAQWRPNAEVPVELAIGFDTGGASASGGFDVDNGARREIRSQH
jgi:hypothetical protein